MKRNGRLNDYLAADDYSGRVRYASELKLDYWGNRTKKPLERNPQELVRAMDDPTALPWARTADYEVVTTDDLKVPLKIGVTNVNRQFNNPGVIVNARIYGTQ